MKNQVDLIEMQGLLSCLVKQIYFVTLPFVNTKYSAVDLAEHTNPSPFYISHQNVPTLMKQRW